MQAEFIGFKQQTQQEMPCTYLDSRWCFYTCGIEWTCRAWKKTCVHTPWYTMCSTLRTLDNILSFVSMPYIYMPAVHLQFSCVFEFHKFLAQKKTVCPPHLRIFPHHPNWRISPSASLPPASPFFPPAAGLLSTLQFLTPTFRGPKRSQCPTPVWQQRACQGWACHGVGASPAVKRKTCVFFFRWSKKIDTGFLKLWGCCSGDNILCLK